jgi:hypothetical protein
MTWRLQDKAAGTLPVCEKREGLEDILNHLMAVKNMKS